MKEEPATVIDAKDLIVGRLCSHVAKRSLLGEKINIINIDLSIITGTPEQIYARYRQKRERGRPTKGPFLGRSAQDLFKRSLKRMLPFKTARGQEAIGRIKVYKGIPARFKDNKTETLASANVNKVPNLKYIRLQELTKHLGGK
jgi:large subunit ribosomal protein L13